MVSSAICGLELKWDTMEHLSQKNARVEEVIFGLFGNLLSVEDKVPMLSKLATSRLERMVVHYQAENHTLSYAILDTVREVLFDNTTSAEWSETPFATLKEKLKDGEKLAPLPPSAFPAPPTPPPAGIGTYLKATLSTEVFTLLQFVLHYGCRPDEADELFSLEDGTCSTLLAKQLTDLGAFERRGHLGSDACWPVGSLRFVSKNKKPKCKCCQKSAVKILQLATMLAPEQIEVVEVKKEEPKRKSKPIKVRPLRAMNKKEDSSWFSGRSFIAASALALILVSPLYFLDGNVAKATSVNLAIDEEKTDRSIAHCPTTGKKLKKNEEVEASPAQPFPIRCRGSVDVVLKPGSSARVIEGGIELLTGELVVDIPEEMESPFKICCGFYSSPLGVGRFVANRNSEEGKLAVYRGETKIRLAGVVTYNVETMRQATVDGEGHIKISDLVTPLPQWLSKWYDSVRLTSKKSSSSYTSTREDQWNNLANQTKRPYSRGISTHRRSKVHRSSGRSLKRVAKSSDFYRHLF